MKTAFEEWAKKHDLYESDRPYAEDAFHGGLQYMLDLINASMPPEVSKAIGEAVRENLGVEIE